MSLLILWVLGLVTGFSLGGAIHLLLLEAGVVLLIERLSASRAGLGLRSTRRHTLIPTPHSRAPKGGIPLKPRATGPSRIALSPAPRGGTGQRRPARPAVAVGPRAGKAAAG